MARKRMIDPRIWDSEQVMKLTPTAFKVYVYLISQSDDAGKVPVSYPMFTSRIFPFGDAEVSVVEDAIKEMDIDGLIILYFVDGKQFIKHPNWTKYQKLDHPTESTIPEPPAIREDSPKAREGSRKRRSNGIEVKRKEVKGIEGEGESSAGAVERVDPFYTDFFKKLKEAFESKNAELDYKREGPAIKWIVTHALTRDDPASFLKSMLNLFWKLTHDQREKIWYQQPFLPSVMRSGGLWPRLLTKLQDHAEDVNAAAQVAELTKGWWT